MEYTNKSQQDNVKMNLTLPRGFYELLVQESDKNYMKTATWVKQFLMRHLLNKHNTEFTGGMNDEPRNVR
jgi:hypothetical protein